MTSLKTSAAVAVIALLTLAASAQTHVHIRCRVKVPSQYQKTSPNPSPNGEPEAVRYAKAYEAFWWNRVSVKAADIKANCPIITSGTPAASGGAADGATSAEDQINRALKKHDAAEVRKYLRSLAAMPQAKEKMSPYFTEPTPEK